MSTCKWLDLDTLDLDPFCPISPQAYWFVLLANRNISSVKMKNQLGVCTFRWCTRPIQLHIYYGCWISLEIISSKQQLRNRHLSFQVSTSRWTSKVKIVQSRDFHMCYLNYHIGLPFHNVHQPKPTVPFQSMEDSLGKLECWELKPPWLLVWD